MKFEVIQICNFAFLLIVFLIFCNIKNKRRLHKTPKERCQYLISFLRVQVWSLTTCFVWCLLVVDGAHTRPLRSKQKDIDQHILGV